MFRAIQSDGNSKAKQDQTSKPGYNPSGSKQSDARMSMTYSSTGTAQSTLSKIDKLSLTHPSFKGRSERLDLLTHNLLGITTSIGEKNYALCDISQTGFSYAQEIPDNPKITISQLMAKVRQFAETNEGKTLPFHFFFKNMTHTGKVKLEGQVRSHQLFFGLNFDEIEVEIQNFLFAKGVKRKFDPNQYYDKTDLFLRSAKKFGKRHNWDQHSTIAMNVTFNNLLAEMGANEKVLNQIQFNYTNRPLFLKFGLSINDPEQAEQFFLFAQNRDPNAQENNLKEKLARKEAKQPFIEKLNNGITPKQLLASAWKAGLTHFRLPSHHEFPHPKDKEELAAMQNAFKQHNGKLEALFDEDFRNRETNACQDFLTEHLYWIVVAKDKSYFDKKKVAVEVKEVMSQNFVSLLKKMGYKEKR